MLFRSVVYLVDLIYHGSGFCFYFFSQRFNTQISRWTLSCAVFWCRCCISSRLDHHHTPPSLPFLEASRSADARCSLLRWHPSLAGFLRFDQPLVCPGYRSLLCSPAQLTLDAFVCWILRCQLCTALPQAPTGRQGSTAAFTTRATTRATTRGESPPAVPVVRAVSSGHGAPIAASAFPPCSQAAGKPRPKGQGSPLPTPLSTVLPHRLSIPWLQLCS